jgi:hypothetical protein
MLAYVIPLDRTLPTVTSPSTNAPILPSDFHGARAALVVAHPGHELRVHGWLSLARPTVFVLTDGSGHSGISRLGATTRITEKAGAKAGCLYGRFTDIDIYKALLDRRFDLFTCLTEELAGALQKDDISYVAGDAIEGYNPVHDICRLVIDSAVRLIRGRAGREIANLDFLLIGNPAESQSIGGSSIYLTLNEELHSQKLEAAAAYSELSGDVDQALASFGAEAFRVESLRPASQTAFTGAALDGPPFYEQYGEKQVAAGIYDRVVRYREHMLPLFASLDHYVEQSV